MDDYLSFSHYKLTGDPVAGWSAPTGPVAARIGPCVLPGPLASGAGLRIDS